MPASHVSAWTGDVVKVAAETSTWSTGRTSSRGDGRYEQKARLAATVADGSGRFAYIVEGSLASWEGGVHGPNRCAWAALVKSALRDRIPVFHTATAADTAQLVAYLSKQMQDGGFAEGASSSTHVILGWPAQARQLDGAFAIFRAM